MVDNPHRQIRAFMVITAAVQNALRCVPCCPTDDGLMMIRLEILVFLAVVLFGFVILVVGRISLSGKHVSAVPFVSHNGNDPVCGPVCIQRPVSATTSGRDCHLCKYIGHLLWSTTVQKRGVHPSDYAGLCLVDGQDLFLAAEAVRDLHFVIAEKAWSQEPPTTEAPL